MSEGQNFSSGINYGFVKSNTKDKNNPNKATVKNAINKALQLRGKHPYVYKTDIISFFDKIERPILKEIIKRKIRKRSLHNIIFKMIDCEIYTPDRNKFLRIESAGIKKGVGLRQGMPISPYLSNLMLYDFDLTLKAKNVRCVRYADDLIVFGNSKEECVEYEGIIKDALGKIELSVPDISDEKSKSKIFKPNEDVDFLGMGIAYVKGDYRIIITNKQLNSISDKIMSYANLEYCYQNNINLGKLISNLESLRNIYNNYYENCYIVSKSKLDNLFKINIPIVIESLLKDVVCKDFSIDRLSHAQKKFLGLDYIAVDSHVLASTSKMT